MHKRFAIVKLWPDLKTAEDECIARIKLSANRIGVECVEVDSFGNGVEDQNFKANHTTVDFVIHLHFDTPKCYDAFSFVALWNPLDFFHEWGYSRTTRNLLTHDDFLSCDSISADDHVGRCISNFSSHLYPELKLHHSLPGLMYSPSLGVGKIFYCGINWERVNGGKSRHQELLKRLDSTGKLRIYGPRIFQGVNVWEGYRCYIDEVPFDGVSMIQHIHDAGVCLVLSSVAHKNSGLMSNRLFEAISAGALVICDENPFAQKHFGDSLLYINSNLSVSEIETKISEHLTWINENPDQAIAKIAESQKIFSEKFDLTQSLSHIYSRLSSRKIALQKQSEKTVASSVTVFYFAFHNGKYFDINESGLLNQTYNALKLVIVVPSSITTEQFENIKKSIQNSDQHNSIIKKIDFCENKVSGRERALGDVINELLTEFNTGGYINFCAPNEKYFSTHIQNLVQGIESNDNATAVSTAAILIRGDEQVNSVSDLIDYGHVDVNNPPGLGRFLFDSSALPVDIGLALRHLRGRPLAALISRCNNIQLLQATVFIDLSCEYPKRDWNDIVESQILIDYSPGALDIKHGPLSPNNINSKKIGKIELLKRATNLNWTKRQIELIKRDGFKSRIDKLVEKVSIKNG